MKTKLLLITAILVTSASQAQLGDFMNRAKNRAKAKAVQKADQKVDQQVDKALDTPIKKKDGDTKQDSEAETKDAESGADNSTETKTSSSSETPATPAPATGGGNDLKAYSKFDFVPGDKILAMEDFSETNVGDYPARWNTNGSAEVVTLNKYPGKWLKIGHGHQISYIPEYITSLPDNFTLEYDVIYQMDMKNNQYTHYLSAVLTQANKPDEKMSSSIVGNFGMAFSISGGAGDEFEVEQITGNTYGVINVSKNLKQLTNENAGKIFHISLWRQNQRLRVYVNGDKVFDLPRVLVGTGELNQFRFFAHLTGLDDAYYVSNLRLATGSPDTKNKLITEGKWVTRGILFDINSDKIKGESYGVLKELATVLKDNGDVKVKIIGHTDSDGDDAKNLALSKKRAEAVKTALVNEFQVDAGRFETDGKGESQPVDSNNSKEGKANNRRVEFIKLN